MKLTMLNAEPSYAGDAYYRSEPHPTKLTTRCIGQRSVTTEWHSELKPN